MPLATDELENMSQYISLDPRRQKLPHHESGTSTKQLLRYDIHVIAPRNRFRTPQKPLFFKAVSALPSPRLALGEEAHAKSFFPRFRHCLQYRWWREAIASGTQRG
jgi:hypothetical protein